MAGTKYRIVWIEDDPELLRLSQIVLSHKGFDVVPISDSREGYEIVRREKPDVVVLDLMMPEIDGWSIYNRIKADADLKHIPVVVVTAKAQAADKAMALHLAKVDGYLTKPYDQSQLVTLLNQVIKQREGEQTEE